MIKDKEENAKHYIHLDFDNCKGILLRLNYLEETKDNNNNLRVSMKTNKVGSGLEGLKKQDE